MRFYNYVDIDGKMLLDEDIACFWSDPTPSMSERIICFKQNGFFGYMNLDGMILIKPRYSYASDFSEGLAYVERRPGRGGYIDINGNFVISLRGIEHGSQFKNSMASVTVSRRGVEKEGVMGINGRWIIKPKYDSVYYNSVYGIWELDNYQLNSDGFKETLLESDLYFVDTGMMLKGYECINIISSTAFTAYQGEKACFVNISNGQALRCESEFIEWRTPSEGLIIVKNGSLYGFTDFNGNLIIDYQFSDVRQFSEGLAAVCVGGKWGYIANPLIYLHWESDELNRAKSMGIIPLTSTSDRITNGEFATQLMYVFDIKTEILDVILVEDGEHLTRNAAAKLISFVANERDMYNRYFLPDCEDRYVISEDAKYQVGFAIQTGVLKLQDYLFSENNEVSRDEAYVAILRLYEYLLDT